MFAVSLCLSVSILGQTPADSLAPQAPDQDTPLNILWLIAEDMGPELGCCGTPQVVTPNLDQLAADGVRYTEAYATTPVCSPSRSAFMTGMHAVTIGAHNHRSHRDDDHTLPDGVRLLTDHLRELGYFTANIRQFPADNPDTPSWKGTGKTDWNFQYEGKPFDSAQWADLNDHQPFYAQINFQETHRGKAWNTAQERIDTLADPEHITLPPYYPDHPIARQDWADYLNTVMSLDAKIGDVLARLDRDGLADNTIVIFFGDHGRAMVRGKQWCYSSGLHVPLIIRWPEGFKPPADFVPGATNDRLIELIDLAASTIDLAGGEKPASMQGRIILGAHAEPERAAVFASRDRCDETVFRIRTVYDGRYRYIRNFMPERPFLQLNRYKLRQYPVITLMHELAEQGQLEPYPSVLLAPTRPAEELYDLLADPYEVVNLADSDAHSAIKTRLRRTLDEWIMDVDDQGRIAEPAEIVTYWEERMKATYDRRKTP